MYLPDIKLLMKAQARGSQSVVSSYLIKGIQLIFLRGKETS